MAKSSGPARKRPNRSAAKSGRTARPAARKPAKAAAKPAARKKASKATAKPAAKAKARSKPAASKPKVTETPRTIQPAPAPKQAAEAAKPARKGITIVTPKPVKKGKEKPRVTSPAAGGQLLRPGAPLRAPLIPSGPNAPKPMSLTPEDQKPRKSPFNKRQLERFREILLRKRAELAGDVSQMESEALQSQSGSLSNLPQHMAEQGSDTYGQTLALDLAAADRRLIREIDDALRRIDEGTYGICELTGKPIKAERLEELPWARYSIEAARELERRSGGL